MKIVSKFRDRYSFVRGNFLILIITWVLMNFSGPIPSTYSSVFFKSLGSNDFLLGVISFGGYIALAVVQFPGGYLADSRGRRSLVVTMTYGVALSFTFFIFAPSWPFIVLGLIIQNLCLIYQPALFAIMLDSVPPEHRGEGFTLQSIVNNIVTLPAALIAGYLILIFDLNFGMRIAYAIVLIAYFLAATLRIRLKETLSMDEVGNVPSFLAAIHQYPKSVRESLSVWGRVPKSVFYLFIGIAGISSLVAGCQTYFVVYARDVLALPLLDWAIVMMFMAISSSVPSILAGLRMDAAGRKSFLVLGFLLYIPAMLIFVRADLNLLFLAFFFFGLAQTLQGTSYNALLGDLVPRNLRGKVIGCSQFFIYLSQAVCQLVVGALYAYVSPQMPFVLLAAGAIPLSILVFLKVFDPHSKEV